MNSTERVNKVLSMPNHRKPPVPERLSTLESLVAELVVTVRKINDLICKSPKR